MTVVRSFIAIDLSAEILAKLEQVKEEILARLPQAPVRWVPTGNIHLTLKFLGDVSVANVEVLHKLLGKETAILAPFEISVGELGAFPNLHRPRVVWVGVQAPSSLKHLQHIVEAETSRLGYVPEEKGFTPHLTLGRVSRNASPHQVQALGQVLESVQVGYLGSTRVKSVEFYKSDLRPAGAVYTRLFSAHLGPQPAA